VSLCANPSKTQHISLRAQFITRARPSLTVQKGALSQPESPDLLPTQSPYHLMKVPAHLCQRPRQVDQQQPGNSCDRQGLSWTDYLVVSLVDYYSCSLVWLLSGPLVTFKRAAYLLVTHSKLIGTILLSLNEQPITSCGHKPTNWVALTLSQ
jgi:hypothetical protein